MSFFVNTTVLGTFFPAAWNDDNGNATAFVNEDSNYRLIQPTWSPLDSSTYEVSMVQDHIRGKSKDDHAVVAACVDPAGRLLNVKVRWWLGGNDQIPDIVVEVAKDITKAVGYAADIAAILTLQPELIPEIQEMATEIADTIQKIADTFNQLAAYILTKADDGGRMNFIAVVCHNVNRVCASINVMAPPLCPVRLDTDQFANVMNHSWGNGTIIKNNPNCMEYAKRVTDGDTCNYRTWLMDTSPLPAYQNKTVNGLMVSSKIDHIRGLAYDDDHVIVLLAFDTAGQLIMGQVSAKFEKEDPLITDPVTGQTPDSVRTGVGKAFQSLLKKSYGMTGSNDGRHYLPDVIMSNIDVICQSVRVSS